MRDKVKSALLITLGSISLIFGIIGIWLPGLPTTPLVLLTLYCYAKGSKRMDLWLRNTALYKKYLYKYAERKALTRKEKLTVQVLSSAMFIISITLVDNTPFRIFMVLLLIAHNIGIGIFIPTYRGDKSDDLGKS